MLSILIGRKFYLTQNILILNPTFIVFCFMRCVTASGFSFRFSHTSLTIQPIISDQAAPISPAPTLPFHSVPFIFLLSFPLTQCAFIFQAPFFKKKKIWAHRTILHLLRMMAPLSVFSSCLPQTVFKHHIASPAIGFCSFLHYDDGPFDGMKPNASQPPLCLNQGLAPSRCSTNEF